MKASNLVILSHQINTDFFKQYLNGLNFDLFLVIYVCYLHQPVGLGKLCKFTYLLTKVYDINKKFAKARLFDYIDIDEYEVCRVTGEGLRLCLLYEEFVDSFVEAKPYLFK